MNSILLIDQDIASNYHNERVILNINEFAKVMIASDGKDGISWILQGNCPDLILMDIKIQVMDGLEFLRVFNEHCFNKKERTVIATLSNATHFEERRKVQKLGVNHHIIKPLTEQKMERLLAELKINIGI
jgi:response regulator of citrate/malate metabolism